MFPERQVEIDPLPCDRASQYGSAERQRFDHFVGVGLVQEKIESGSYEPNAPSTIRKKKSDKPLIDTGRMRQSVKYVIRKKGSG